MTLRTGHMLYQPPSPMTVSAGERTLVTVPLYAPSAPKTVAETDAASSRKQTLCVQEAAVSDTRLYH